MLTNSLVCCPSALPDKHAAAEPGEAAVQMGETVAKVQPLELEWQGIGCSYSTARGSKVVLQDVWGKAVPGQMKVGVHGGWRRVVRARLL